MIDYDKLKIAHELANKLPFDSYSFDCWCCSGIASGYFYVLTFEDKEDLSNEYESEKIDDLITKLRELTQSEPRYKVGDKLYWLRTNLMTIESLNVQRISEDEGLIRYWSNGQFFYEDKLYPTKAALIVSQIEYWQELRNKEMLANHWKPSYQGETMNFVQTSIDEYCNIPGVVIGYGEPEWMKEKRKREELESIHPLQCKLCGQKTAPNPTCFLGGKYNCEHEWVPIESKECKHESDSYVYGTPSGNGDIPKDAKYKCIKCGEFYQ